MNTYELSIAHETRHNSPCVWTMKADSIETSARILNTITRFTGIAFSVGLGSICSHKAYKRLIAGHSIKLGAYFIRVTQQ